MRAMWTASRVLIVLILCLQPSALWAWNLKIQSALFSFRYLYASQMGSRGFFGTYDVDLGSTGGDLASLNGWFNENMVSGTTGVAASTRLVIFPVLEVNRAVSLFGTYRIGPFRADNIEDLLNMDTDPVIFRRRALRDAGKWTRLWIEVDTPLGRIFYGKRWFRQGCGLQFGSGRTAEELDDTARRSEEILQLEAFTGPLTIGGGFYPWRRGSRRYRNVEDHNAARAAHALGYVRYTAACLDMGAGGFYLTFNEGPEAERTTTARASAVPSNTATTEGWLYLKFNNGRFFFNTEADWFYRTIRRQRSQNGYFFDEPPELSGGGGSPFAPSYIESWRYMSEFGVFSGPVKASLLLAHMPGPDRRHGILIDRQPYVQEADKSAYGVFYPYCLLMAKVYRAGVNSFRDMSDSNVVAGHVSYMLASNLELYTSLLHAQRASDGYSLGYVQPSGLTFGRVYFAQQGTFDAPVPTVPDRDLGWEFNLGLVWNLLENWQLHGRGAYWKPGRWFNYACVDKSVPNWDDPSPTNNFGVNPSRTIDPILGFELYLDARF